MIKGKYFSPDMLEFLAILSKHKVEFVIVGGEAVIYYGYARLTGDIDVAAYFEKEIPLLELGKIIFELGKVANRKVDFVVLNDLYKKDPFFAFNIIQNYKLLFVRNEDLLINFKTRTQLEYFDVAPMLEMFRKSFNKRIEEGKFGERNYEAEINTVKK